MMKTALINYYTSISKPNKALAYNWNDLAAIGLDDPREVFKLNQELIADGALVRVSPKNTSGDSSLFLVAK